LSTLVQTLHLAVRYHQAGDLRQAEQLYRQILQEDPAQGDALHLLGLITARSGQPALACDYIRQALRSKPNFAEAHSNLGNILLDLGQRDEAVACYRHAIRLKPDYAEAHYNLGNALWLLGKLEEAEASLQQALLLKSDFAGAYNCLGIVLLLQGKVAQAVTALRQAVRLEPAFAAAYINLGHALELQDQLEEALDVLRVAVRLDPGNAGAFNNLGVILGIQGKLDEAQANYARAIDLRPDFVRPHQALGGLYLLRGDFEKGWPELDWRWHSPDYKPRHGSRPRWDGASLENKTILLYADEGVGDTIQFIRYGAVLQQRGARVVVECQPELVELLACCAGIDHLLPVGAPLPDFDLQAPLVSLPGKCRTTLNSIPAAVPYLAAERDRVVGWRDRLGAQPGFKIGICWQGNPANTADRYRSVSLAQFAPLAQVAGARLVSLQRGPGREQLGAALWEVLELHNQAEEPAPSWLETAALITALDLVVTVDTAVAHLAGALGVTVWLALPFIPDWRWMLNRDDSPWYPSMRLFRQSQPGQWAPVFEQITHEVRMVVSRARGQGR
jgi:tetratricopeptide (TPR) repeat protein